MTRIIKTQSLFFCLVFLLSLLLGGCSRDPNIRKQKYLESGKRYAKKEQYKEAAIQFMNAVRLDPQFAEAHYQLALAELKLGSGQLGYQELMKTVQIQPQYVQAQIDLARLLLISRLYADAQQHAVAVLAVEPNNIEAIQINADCNASLNHVDIAVQQMTRAVELDPGRSESYLNLGALQSEDPEQLKHAEESFRKAIELTPNAIAPHLVLGSFLDDQKRFPEAAHEFKEAINLDQKSVTARALLVKHYMRANQPDLAEQAAKEAKEALGSDPREANFLAKYYLRTGNTGAATYEMADLAKRFPKDRDTQHAYLELLLAENHDDEAMRETDSILKDNAKDSVALVAKGMLLIRKGRPSDGRDILVRCLKSDPQNVVAGYQLGLALKALGDPLEAKSHWLQVVRIKPDYLPAQHALADMALEDGDYTGVHEIANALKKALPNSQDGYLLQASADLKQMQFSQAESEFREAIKVAPKSAQPHSKLGLLLVTMKRDKEASQEFQDATQINPTDIDSLLGLAQIDINRKQDAKALLRMDDAIKNSPSNPALHFLYGQLLTYEKNLPKAAEEFSKTLQMQPKYKEAYFMLAGVQSAQNQVDAAANTYLQEMQQYPQDTAACVMLGSLYDQAGRISEAETYYRKALEIRPDLGIAANNLAYLLLKNGGDLNQALEFAQIARRQLPDSPAVEDTLGWVYLQKGLNVMAIDTLQHAVKGNPENATYHYHLGLAYQKSGDIDKARTELQRAAQLDNGKPELEEVKKSLSQLTAG